MRSGNSRELVDCGEVRGLDRLELLHVGRDNHGLNSGYVDISPLRLRFEIDWGLGTESLGWVTLSLEGAETGHCVGLLFEVLFHRNSWHNIDLRLWLVTPHKSQ